VRRFEDVAAVLAELDVDRIWDAASSDEKRVLVDELLSEVALYPDHLEVEVAGTPRLDVLLDEVGLTNRGKGRPQTHRPRKCADCECPRGDLNPHSP